MRQDPNAVPHPRASYEQIAYQPDQDEQAPAWQPQDRQSPARRPQPRQSPARQSPAWQPPEQRPPYQPTPYQPTSYRQAPPIYPAAQRPTPAPVNGWQGMPQPQFGDPETEATLASVRAAQRKARRMQAVCVLLGACTAAIFLTAAVSHQLDAHVELLTPVLLLTSTVNFRRYAQRAAKYRAAEADILARVR